ncbi:serine hydrolase [Iamia sp. SCSIO 61187]|uniref:serine hydrolase domain-containing protein n=1 Tax=Iamia sp. SCSIO 61187 TaxID=2722752 RepID=UPI001C63539E|nr:serine hydrolase [Iamia sp. SCSIO 61187]QYG94000.1 serine hydrolase [Iamia sp. SCSIO 61187]
MAELRPFPPHPDDVAWPTTAWEEAPAPPEVAADELDARLDRVLGPDQDPAVGHTNAVAVVHRGRIVAERYGEVEMGPLAELAGVQPGPITPATPLHSWSMAKSVCHLLVGIAQEQGHLRVTDPAPVPAWADDERSAITWDHLLQMRAGLQWAEVYEGFGSEDIPDVVAMLYGEASSDMAAFAAGFPLVHEPGSPEAYTYSSGTTNIVQGCLQRVLQIEGDVVTRVLRELLFDPIGVTSLSLGFDGSGLWVASSYLDLTLRDWLRLGLLVLRGGQWDGRQLVPGAWIDHGRTPRSESPLDPGIFHGAHWWARAGRDDGGFMAHGFEGQRLLLVPDRDLVVFRNGKTASDQVEALNEHLWGIVDLFPRIPA